jgi:hypothetical protein
MPVPGVRRDCHDPAAVALITGALALAFGTEVAVFVATFQMAKQHNAQIAAGSDLRIRSESSGSRHLTLLPDATCDGPAGDGYARSDSGVQGQIGDTAVSAWECLPRPAACHAGTVSLTAVDRCSGHAVTGVRLCGRVT